MSLLTRLNEGGTTVVVATHDMPIVERFKRRIVRLEFGLVKEDIAVDDGASESVPLPDGDGVNDV
jgi:cell division transport system ATP-binding protein